MLFFLGNSHAQTKRVYAAANERFLGKRQINSSALNEYCALQTLLKPYPVFIPYVESLAQYFPHEILRTRRDYSRFLALVETSAILHQEQRPKQEIDSTVFLRATLADYEIARILCEESLLRSIYELPPKTVELIHKAAGLLKDGKGSENGTFTITDLSKELEWDRDTVTKWLKQAQKKTFITLVAENVGNKGSRYCLEGKPLPNESFLPTVETLARLNPNESTEGIYNPITGERVVIKKPAPPDATPMATSSTQDISSSAQPSEHASGNSDKNID
jgi:predicted transcriptional regulator